MPYTDAQVKSSVEDLTDQALEIMDVLEADGIEIEHDREIVALIAYLQRLGVDGRVYWDAYHAEEKAKREAAAAASAEAADDDGGATTAEKE